MTVGTRLALPVANVMTTVATQSARPLSRMRAQAGTCAEGVVAVQRSESS